MNERSSPNADGVARAAERLAGRALLTPLLENAELSARAGGRLFIKAETLQHCGSFKFRGAFNRLVRLDAAARRRGVLAWSSGNHAQGVARAGRILGVSAVIVMPRDAPAVKAERVRADGAEIVLYDRYTEDREAIGRRIAQERGMTIVPSFDDVDIIEGQGTLALEAAAQALAAGARLDAFVVPCGGGGLASGCALALEAAAPGAEVLIAEPEGYDDALASLRDGVVRTADQTRRTICDSIATPHVGEITFPVLRRLVRGGASVSEAETGQAVAFAFKYLKLVVEPGGAAALAAILAGKINLEGRVGCVALSGGNVDPALFARLIGAAR
jgi:threonine dehydratase